MNVDEKLKEIFKARDEFFKLLDQNVPKINGTEVFDFKNAKSVDLKDVYAKFYAYDYSVRKLLPDVYKAFDIK
ncbi:CmeU family protein [Campylobacter gastrosuis]|uniref:Chain-length determining protein n=1 Tax=Campylobacter gastrosuis TaxID=2974576 RepID=A0ABT7HNH9_9BACT|nr:CmeU family protein [Campylobacter gastrosuis]MDL0088477.1 hypothetical protein [Campylobacter gastrosuis]